MIPPTHRRGLVPRLLRVLLVLAATWPAAAGTLSITVRDANGEPLPGARVFLFGDDGPATAEATTGERGEATFDAVPDTTRYVLVVAGDLSPAVSRLETPPPARVRLDLPAGRSVRWRLLDADHGTPLPEVSIVASPMGEPYVSQPWLGMAASRRLTLRPDPETGTVRATGLPAGPAAMLVLAPGHRLRFYPELPGDGEVLELDTRGCRRVRVVEEETGRPVPGARILPAIFYREASRSAASPGIPGDLAELAGLARTADDGRAVVCPLPEQGDRFTVLATDHPPVEFSLPADDAVETVVRVSATARLDVRVVEEGTSAPVPGLTVRLRSGGTGTEIPCGPGGEAVFRHVPAGHPVTILAIAPGGTEPLAEELVPALRPGERATATLAVAPSLRLRIEDPDGPLADVPVVLIEPPGGASPNTPRVLGRARTDGDGTATLFLGDTLPGDALVALRVGDTLVVRPVPPPSDPELPLEPRPLLVDGEEARVRVVAEGSGLPVPGAVLRCLEGEEARPSGVAARPGSGPLALEAGSRVELLPRDAGILAVAGTDGAADVLLAGPCDGLLVEGPVGEHQRWGKAALAGEDLAAATDSRVTVELPRATGIVVVPVFAGAPAPRIAIEVRPADDPRRVAGTAGGPPSPRDVSLPAGRVFLVVVRAAGTAPAVLGPLEGSPDWPRIEAPLLPGGELRILLPPGPGPAPADGLLVDTGGIDWWPLADRRQARDDDGPVLVLGPLPAGRWELELAGGACRESVTIEPGATTTASCR